LACLVCCAALLLSGCTAKLAQQPADVVSDTAPSSAVADTEPPPAPPETEKRKKPVPKPVPTPTPTPIPDQPLSGPGFDDISIAFGFADQTGSRLIVVDYVQDEGPDYDGPNFEDPAHYTMAIGQYGGLVRISYSSWQDETGGNNYRDAAHNFDNLPGYVFSVADGMLQPDKTYILIAEGPFIESFVALYQPSAQPDGTYGYAPPAMMGRDAEDYIQMIKGRGVKWAELLAETEGGGQIGLVLFERQGDDMLFSIVYMDGDKVLFWDCPGQYDEYSTWRVDMGDEPGAFTPLFMARLDSGLMLTLTWGAPEGESIVILQEDNGRFVENADYSYSRYWSPP